MKKSSLRTSRFVKLIWDRADDSLKRFIRGIVESILFYFCMYGVGWLTAFIFFRFEGSELPFLVSLIIYPAIGLIVSLVLAILAGIIAMIYYTTPSIINFVKTAWNDSK